MDTFKLLKLKNYFFHIVIGTLAILLGIGIFQAILMELLKEFDSQSKIAYICGMIACAGIIFYGIYQIRQAFDYEKRILKSLEPQERKEFLAELSESVELSIPRQVVMTKNYLLVPVKNSGVVRVFAKSRLVGCFMPDVHQEAEATEGQMIIYDMEFKPANVNIRGKGSTQDANRLYEAICETAPWICYEDYDSFLAQIRKSGYRRKLVKQIKDAKMRYETGYNSDTEADNELKAMSLDVQNQLNPESFFKRFLSKKSK